MKLQLVWQALCEAFCVTVFSNTQNYCMAESVVLLCRNEVECHNG